MSKLDLIEKDLLAILNKRPKDDLALCVKELLNYIRRTQSECMIMLNSQQNKQRVQPPFSWEILQSENSPFKTS